jgi:cobaltochelatase CobT
MQRLIAKISGVWRSRLPRVKVWQNTVPQENVRERPRDKKPRDKKPWQDRPPYSVFTRDFDKVVSVGELDSVLGKLSNDERASFDEARRAFEYAIEGWRTKVHLAALDASERVRDLLDWTKRSDTIIVILVDHSGSMRGQKILLAAAAAEVARDFIELLGAQVEVLGFTTVSWRGGEARKLWKNAGEPAQPGRLCDLLHIVYQSIEERRLLTGGRPFSAMLRPHLLKENIDGEALEWAAARLRARPETRKRLLVVSDGAPVDDSTLLTNDPDILDRHLKQVAHDLETSPDIEVAALGIGFDVRRYYANAVRIATVQDLGTAMIALLESMMVSAEEEEVGGSD